MIAVTEHPEGLVLPIRAQPGARKVGLAGERNGALKVAVTAPPEQGRANQALIDLLREILDLKWSQIELLKGETSRDKCFLIRGLSRAELEARLTDLTK